MPDARFFRAGNTRGSALTMAAASITVHSRC